MHLQRNLDNFEETRNPVKSNRALTEPTPESRTCGGTETTGPPAAAHATTLQLIPIRAPRVWHSDPFQRRVCLPIHRQSFSHNNGSEKNTRPEMSSEIECIQVWRR